MTIVFHFNNAEYGSSHVNGKKQLKNGVRGGWRVALFLSVLPTRMLVALCSRKIINV